MNSSSVLLALDTSTEYCSVALAVFPSHSEKALHADAEIEPLKRFIRHEATGIVSSERLLPAVREVFEEAQCDLRDCAALAFGAGPGAFTGIRTAAGVAQGLAFALQIPVIPVNTLLACAQAARCRNSAVRRVLVALDARMDEVYWGVFEWQETHADWRTVQSTCVTAPESVTASGKFTLAGNAVALFGARLMAQTKAVSIDQHALPHAASIARLGWRDLCAGRAVSAVNALPEYVRHPVALKTTQRAAQFRS